MPGGDPLLDLPILPQRLRVVFGQDHQDRDAHGDQRRTDDSLPDLRGAADPMCPMAGAGAPPQIGQPDQQDHAPENDQPAPSQPFVQGVPTPAAEITQQ